MDLMLQKQKEEEILKSAEQEPELLVRHVHDIEQQGFDEPESAEALKGYSVHSEHVAVADSKVRPYTKIRSCLDYEV